MAKRDQQSLSYQVQCEGGQIGHFGYYGVAVLESLGTDKLTKFLVEPPSDECHLVGLFAGDDGGEVATFVKERFADRLSKCTKFKEAFPEAQVPSRRHSHFEEAEPGQGVDTEKIEEALAEVFTAIDGEMITPKGKERLTELEKERIFGPIVSPSSRPSVVSDTISEVSEVGYDSETPLLPDQLGRHLLRQSLTSTESEEVSDSRATASGTGPGSHCLHEQTAVDEKGTKEAGAKQLLRQSSMTMDRFEMASLDDIRQKKKGGLLKRAISKLSMKDSEATSSTGEDVPEKPPHHRKRSSSRSEDEESMGLDSPSKRRRSGRSSGIQDTISQEDMDEIKRRDENIASMTGASAFVALVVDDHVVYGHVGDVRCCMNKGGECISLTEPHTAALKDEKTHVEDAGGIVRKNSIDGKVELTRMFGHHQMKKDSNLFQESQKVIVYPDVDTQKLNEDKEVLVIATSGIWSMFQSEDEFMDRVMKIVKKQVLDKATFSSKISLETLCFEVCKEAMEKKRPNSPTSVGLMVVMLEPFMSVTPDSKRSSASDSISAWLPSVDFVKFAF